MSSVPDAPTPRTKERPGGSIPRRFILDSPYVPEEERLENPHPGETIREDYLVPLGMTPYRLAKLLRVPVTRVHEILAGRRGISADTALRLGRLFGTTAEFWLALQAAYALEAAKYAPGTWEEVRQIEPLDLSPWQCEQEDLDPGEQR